MLDPAEIDTSKVICNGAVGTDGEEAELGWFVTRTLQGGVTQVFNVLSNPSLPDSDFDGLPDLIERDQRLHPNETDTDGDGPTDFNEFAGFEKYFGFEQQFPRFFLDGSSSAQHGTDPRLFDTDNDGLSDFEEMQQYSLIVPGEAMARRIVTNPLQPDTDVDGRSDFEERMTPPLTDATDPDTDDDGKTDGDEVDSGSDPLIPNIQVTVRYEQLQLKNTPVLPYDLQWKFHIATNGEFPGTTVSTEKIHADRYGVPWTKCPGLSAGVGYIGNAGSLSTFNGSLSLGEHSFPLRAGQGFILNGTVNEVGSCGPSGVNLNCGSNFFKVISFEELAQNRFTTDTLTLTQTFGSCGAAEIVYTVTID